MKPKRRFSVAKIENAKWMVRDAHTGAYWDWEGRTRQQARAFADAKNTKEFLHTAEIVSIDGEPYADYLARQKKQAPRKWDNHGRDGL
jgi:hypothetical protein